MSDEGTVTPQPERTPWYRRWWMPLAILLAGIAAQGVASTVIGPDRTYQIFAMFVVVPTTLFLMFVWLLALSPGVLRQRLIRGIMVAVSGLVIAACVEVDDQLGDMVPVLKFRWQPGREVLAEQFRRQQAADRAGAAADADAGPLVVSEADWPAFRGPGNHGRAPYLFSSIPDWQQNAPKELWRHPVGPGWSSCAVVGNLVFTQEQRRDRQAGRDDEAVVCYDLETGREVWEHRDPGRFTSLMGGDGPRATPTVYDSRVYALGGTGILNCLNARTGRVVWSRNILNDARAANLEWGMAGSPWVDGDIVVVNPGGKEQSLVAYDRLTGDPRWAGGSDPASYSTPRRAVLNGVDQFLILNGDALAAHRADDGTVLWRFPWTNGPKVNVAIPVVLDDGTVLIGSGYAAGTARVQPPAAGGEATAVWTTNQLKLKFSDPVVHNGYVYGLDEQILTCLDLETGGRMWKRGRYGYGQLLQVGEHLLVLSERGEVVLVDLDPRHFCEVTSFQALDGKTWNHPVISHGRLIVRNAAEIACFDLRPWLAPVDTPAEPAESF